MNERLKILRKHLDLTQQEFADKIGVKRNSYANYEIGRNIPIDAIILSICREYNVNEEWLRNGTGEMFMEVSKDRAIADAVYDLMSDKQDSFQKLATSIVLTYRNLSPSSKEVISNYVDQVIADLESKKSNE